MNTIEIKIDENDIDEELISQAGEIIKAGGLVAFPTETVYGLGGDALNPESSAKIYAAKGRPSDNPLIVHIADMKDLEVVAQNIPPQAYRLADAFWPGPLTMIFQKKDIVPKETTGGLNTVAVRMPSHKTALAFIRAAGGFVAAPSANVSGRPSPTLAKHVAEDMGGRIDMIIDGGAVEIGLESTIIDLSDCKEEPTILRPGYITKKMMEQVIGVVSVDAAIVADEVSNARKTTQHIEDDNGDSIKKQAPRAPGMKYKHYAPKGDLSVVKGNEKDVVAYINTEIISKSAAGEIVGVIATDETMQLYHGGVVRSIGTRTDEESIARHLYSVLREFDEVGATRIYSEEFNMPRIGQAIMNRLIKAAGHSIIQT
ncbi:MAG TPA: L-threonylcarbamoyladenylate synthase [Lachnospiraceae bacterium]|jgi:L-threonylcarbamoyladenylate synthase|nr:L-threonylcarbamoyladenylate synthase [Lachnospiraceae bacterium]